MPETIVVDRQSLGVAEREKFASEQLRLALANLVPNAFMAPVLGGVICLIFSQWVPLRTLAVWWALTLLACIPLAAVSMLYLRKNPDIRESSKWARRATVSHLLFAAIWASMGVVLWVPHNDLNHLLLMLFLACSLSANMALVGAHRPLTLNGYCTHGLLFVLIPLQEGGLTYDALSALAVLYLCYMAAMSVQIFRTAKRMILLSVEKSELLEEKTTLIAALSESKHQAERERARSDASNRAKSEFLANMSHELRTPLNAVLGFSELLQSSAFAQKTDEYARLIHDSGTHLLSLINDILDLSKIEAGKFELRETRVDLVKLISECTTALAAKAAAGQIVLTTDVDAELPRPWADERAMRQILLNLISNAVKFTGKQGRIRVSSAVLPSGTLAIAIADNGIGMSEEDRKTVFESFGQGRHDIVLADKGTGLGLPIVKGLVEAHGGEIAIESKVAVGTTVTVILPKARVPDATEVSECELAEAG